MGALGIFLLAVGAVLTYALETDVSGIDLNVVGIILMVVGGLAVILSLVRGNFGGFRTRTTRQVSDDGHTIVEDQRTTDI